MKNEELRMKNEVKHHSFFSQFAENG